MWTKFSTFVCFFAFTAGMASQAVEPIKYFNMASVKTIRGKVIEIIQEDSKQQHPFVVISLLEKNSETRYRVEVSPEWFFRIDLMTGSQVEINGSDISNEKEHIMMAASITFQGERYQFRDRYGFPLWRGQKEMRKGSEQGKGMKYRRGKG